jgi:hypothetical protein
MAYTTIDDPSAHFQTKIYSGQNSQLAVTNDGNSDLKPDWLWIKSRNDSDIHVVTDSNRGTDLYLSTNSTLAEVSSTADVEAFGTDGFTVNGPNDRVNTGGGLYVAWQWKAGGGTTSTNNDGAVASTVQVNSTAGFSILTYTMNSGSNETVGHGLGVAPKIVITKARERGDSNGFWSFYTTIIDGSLDYLKLNTEGQKNNSSLSAPTSTVFTGAGSSTASYRIFVAYCFAEVQGYSKFGSYVGNGNANGTFVYTGFKPAWIMIKKYDTSDDSWVILDNKRNSTNVVNGRLFPDLTNAESTSTDMVDFLSNGFKLRTSGSAYNGNAVGYISMAFAENPFVTSTGIPTTAR